MAEDFPHYRSEDSDDAPPPRSVEYSAPAPAAEHHASVQQEGTIFSREEKLPSLSRPLFDIINKQEQPAARVEVAEPPKAEALPSVSFPSNPETQTYQPPADAEVAHAIHEDSERSHIEDDDDDDEADAGSPAQPAVQGHQPAPPAEYVPPHVQEAQRTLNEQFDEIIRAEMGDDFGALTSGARLGEALHPAPEDTHTDDEPVAHKPVPPVVVPPVSVPSTVPAEWLTPPAAIPEIPSAEDVADLLEEEPPATEAVPEAFYYDEEPAAADAAEDPLALATVTPGVSPRPFGPFASATPGSGGAPTSARRAVMSPPIVPVGGGGGGSGGSGGGGGYGSGYGGGPSGFNVAPVMPNVGGFAPNPNVFVPSAERQANRNAYWFAAGVVVGWMAKRHFANNEAKRVAKGHQRELSERDDRIRSMEMRQQDVQRSLRASEALRLEVQAAKTRQAAELARQQARTTEAAARAQSAAPGAERSLAVAPVPERASGEQPRAARPGSAEQFRAEQAARPPQQRAEQFASGPFAAAEQFAAARSAAETPLTRSGGGAEAAFAAGYGVPGTSEAPYNRAYTAEAATAAAAAAGAVAEQSQVPAAETGQAYQLKAGQHVERAAGSGHDIIVDRHGEVQNAIAYGEEFQFQKRQEQIRAGTSTDTSEGDEEEQQKRAGGSAAMQQRHGNGGGAAFGGGGNAGSSLPDYSSQIITGLGSGLADVSHEITAGANVPGARARLLAKIPRRPGRDNPVVSTLTSPWLWASVFVLLAAFFLAAFI